MSNVWERFDAIVNPEEVQTAKKEAEERRTTFAPIEAGDYVMTLDSLVPSTSKNGQPMLKGRFSLEDGRKAFYNQMLQNVARPEFTAVNVAEAVDFVSNIIGEEVAFTGLSDFATLVNDMNEITGYNTDGTEMLTLKSEYAVKKFNVTLSYGKNDFDMKFPKLRVNGEVEESDTCFMSIPDGIDELPFE